MTFARQRGLVLAAVMWLLVVGYCTLRPDPAAVARVAALPWYCLACGDGGITDVILNLLLFLPFGLLARLAGWRLLPTIAILALLSASIEVTQGTLLVGRDPSLGDVLCNTAGGGFGWLLWPWLQVIARPTRRIAHLGALVSLLLGAVVWFGTGYAMHPRLSGPQPWFGQWNHSWPAHETFQGSIQRSELAGIHVPNDSMDRLPAHADSLDLVLEVTRALDSIPRLPISILRIVDDDQRVVLAVAQRHRDLRLEVRLRSETFGLRTPEWGFPGAMDVAIATPWRFSWQWFPDRLELRSGPANGIAPASHTTLPLSVALGWILIHPFLNTVDSNAPIWTALWVLWWFGLLGWFAGAAGTRGTAVYAVAGMASFIGASRMSGFPVHPQELLIGMLAFLILGALGRRQGEA